MHDLNSFTKEFEAAHPPKIWQRGALMAPMGLAIFFSIAGFGIILSACFVNVLGFFWATACMSASWFFAGMITLGVGSEFYKYDTAVSNAYDEYLKILPSGEILKRALGIKTEYFERQRAFKVLDDSQPNWSVPVVKDLAFLVASPEVQEPSRNLILSYLNQHHEGWSREFQLSNPTP